MQQIQLDILQCQNQQPESNLTIIISLPILNKQFQTSMHSRTMQEMNSLYLDVSQFIMKQYEPDHHPATSDIRQVKFLYMLSLCQKQQYSSNIFHICTLIRLAYTRIFFIFASGQFQQHITTPQITPDLNPIDIDPSTMKMSPFFGFCCKNPCELEEQFQLEDPQKIQKNSKKFRKIRQRSNTFYLFNPPDFQLEQIIQQTTQKGKDPQSNSDSEEIQQEESIISSEQFSSRNIELSNGKDAEQQKLSTNFLISEVNNNTVPYFTNYKNQLMIKLKEIIAIPNQQLSFEAKIAELKANLSKFLFDYELTAMQAIWNQFQGSTSSIFYEIIKTIQNLFEKKIGVLNFQVRRSKLLKYLQKKKRRIWKKKVSYDCRKKVADNRLRIKGKFVTKEQVRSQLGIEKIDCLTPVELKVLLSRKTEDCDKSVSHQGLQD